MFRFLKERSTTEELMDDLQSSGPSLEHALQELDVINQWLGGNALTLKPLKKAILALHQKSPGTEFTILDLGCGSGAMLQQIIKWGRTKGINLKGIGLDANPNVIHYAEAFNSDCPEIEFKACNVLDLQQIPACDFALCTLFLHHFTKAQLVSLFTALSQKTRQKIIVNDLHRHPFAYYSIKWLTHSFSRSPMVKNDACLSVWRGFKRKEWEEIMAATSIKNYTLHWKWAFRWALIIE